MGYNGRHAAQMYSPAQDRKLLRQKTAIIPYKGKGSTSHRLLPCRNLGIELLHL